MDADTTVAIALWIAVPLGTWLVAHTVDRCGRWRLARTGAWVGAIALPLSLLAYSFYWFVPVVGIAVGLPGLLALMWHLLPFPGAFDELYGAVLATGQPAGAFSAWKPTVFWSIIYALVGACFDRWRLRRTPQKAGALKSSISE